MSLPSSVKLYLVGGAVRDELLGYPHNERDWVVVGATVAQMQDAGFKAVGKDFPVFLHPTSHEEYALARTERKSGRGYHGFVCYSSPDVTLEEDLARRDLTINAIAKDSAGHLIDPYGGQRDLAQRRLKHVSPAFAEDPLRVLRVARFAARYHHLGFRIAEETLDLMRDIVAMGEIETLVAERVWKESIRALLEPNPEVFFLVLHSCGALQRLFPEIATHAQDATWSALMRSAQQQQADLVRFAVLAAELDAQSLATFCERMKAPTQFRELAQLVITQRHPLIALKTAAQALALLEQADAVRRPERFEQFLTTCGTLQVRTGQIDRIRLAWQAMRSVVPLRLVERGFSGKALGEQLQRERLTAIEESWT